MKAKTDSIIIQFFQLEDFLNILLSNDYIVEIEKIKDDKVLIRTYKKEEVFKCE